ncbi:Hypothetical predicted protein, partial [Paramuricea clavata]
NRDTICTRTIFTMSTFPIFEVKSQDINDRRLRSIVENNLKDCDLYHNKFHLESVRAIRASARETLFVR